VPYKFTPREINAEIEEMDKELVSRYVQNQMRSTREQILHEYVAELRLRMKRMEEWIGRL
jgi:hypothetical protein